MRKNVLVDVRIVADVSRGLNSWFCRTVEQKAKQMESLASEFNDFVRDHRSMDWVSLEVEREYQDQCEFCGYAWETDDEGAPLCCEEALTEHEANLAKASHE
jgi:hypothetical protein